MTAALHGRDPELARIDAALAALSETGRGRAIVIQGDAGSGRTALIEAASELAARRSIPVMALAGRREAAAPAAGTSPTGPLLITADDADLAGPATRRALADVAARLPAAPILLLASTSLAALDAETHGLLDVPGAERLVLGDLSRDALQGLLRSAFGAPPEPTCVDAVHAATGGTPAVVAAVTHDARSHGDGGSAWSPDRLARLGTAALLAWLQRHTGGPDAPAARLAFAAAIAGPRFDAIEAMRIAGLAGEDAGAAYDLLVDRGLVTGHICCSEFRHPIVRLALEQAPGLALRAALHARAAAVRHAAGEPPASVARHLLHAVPTGEPWRVEALLAAGEAHRRQGEAEEAEALARRARAEQAAAPAAAPAGDPAPDAVAQQLDDALGAFLAGGEVEPAAAMVLRALDGRLDAGAVPVTVPRAPRRTVRSPAAGCSSAALRTIPA